MHGTEEFVCIEDRSLKFACFFLGYEVDRSVQILHIRACTILAEGVGALV